MHGQVLLDLLVHAEQSASDVPSKTVTIATSAIAGRAMVEIGYSVNGITGADPLNDGSVSLSVCRSILLNHGGDMRFTYREGLACFEVELPILRTEEPRDSVGGEPERSLTILLVDPDTAPQRQLLGLLSLRGHRVVPAAPEEAADLAHRLRFDAVLWAMRLSGPSGGSKWSEFQERTRSLVDSVVLISDGYDTELARSIEEGGNFLLGRPIREAELDRILRQIDARATSNARR